MLLRAVDCGSGVADNLQGLSAGCERWAWIWSHSAVSSDRDVMEGRTGGASIVDERSLTDHTMPGQN